MDELRKGLNDLVKKNVSSQFYSDALDKLLDAFTILGSHGDRIYQNNGESMHSQKISNIYRDRWQRAQISTLFYFGLIRFNTLK